MLSRRAGFAGLACLVCSGFFPAARQARASGPMAPTSLTPDQALAKLMAGNSRFVADNPLSPPIGSGRRHELASGQAPFASIVGCADSRVPPETLFGTGLGEIFTARVAGNTLPAESVGSLAYAVEHLGAPLIMVLGHERCGAVAAAVDVVTKNAQLPEVLHPMVAPILDAVRAVQGQPGDLLDNAVKENARRGARALRANHEFAERIHQGKLKIVAARYDLDDGKVQLLDA